MSDEESKNYARLRLFRREIKDNYSNWSCVPTGGSRRWIPGLNSSRLGHFRDRRCVW